MGWMDERTGGDQRAGGPGRQREDSHACNGSQPPKQGGIKGGSPGKRDCRREGRAEEGAMGGPKWEGRV